MRSTSRTESSGAVFAAVRSATPETMGREQLAEHIARLRRLRSWLDAEDVRAARRTTELAAAGRSESAESMATRAGGRSGRDAADLGRRRELCDQIPEVETALQSGEITAGHVDAMAKATARLDDDARAEFCDLGNEIIAAAATSGVDAFERSMRGLASSITARHTADAGVDELARQRAASSVRRWVDKTTGMHHTHLELDPIRDAKLQAAFNTELARLRAHNSSGTSWGQLQVDAFVNSITGDTTIARSRHGGNAGADAGQRRPVDRVPEITVLIDHDQLTGSASTAGICETENGIPLPVATVRRLCCDAEIIPIVFGSKGEVLDEGRSVRTATRPQRRALRAMHRDCAHPDCTVGFDACRIHHVRWWWDHRGPTDIDNLLPLCERHHHMVHEGGWTLTMTPDRVATWKRPDGSVFHHGTTINRRPVSTSTAPPNPAPMDLGRSEEVEQLALT